MINNGVPIYLIMQQNPENHGRRTKKNIITLPIHPKNFISTGGTGGFLFTFFGIPPDFTNTI